MDAAEGTPDRDPASAGSGPAATAAGPPPRTLTARRDFLACARARRSATPGLLLQGRDRRDDAPPRVGYTCSRKVGNAVARNRAKRRLRAAAREVIPLSGRPGWDYVLIGLADATATRPFARLVADLSGALGRIHARAGSPNRDGRPRASGG